MDATPIEQSEGQQQQDAVVAEPGVTEASSSSLAEAQANTKVTEDVDGEDIDGEAEEDDEAAVPSTAIDAVPSAEQLEQPGEADDDGEAMEESDGEDIASAPQAQETLEEKTEQDASSALAANEEPSATIKVETSDSPIQPKVEETTPSQPANVKQEAMDEVNAFLASVQQGEQQNGSASSGPDLSTPAARRSHLLSRIEKQTRDAEAWLTLLADAEGRLAQGDPDWSLDQVRDTYEQFLQVYPAAARQWQAYINLELSMSNFQQVEQLFTRCLISTPSVSLWSSYLSYTRRVNPLPPPTAGSSDEDGERGRVRKVITDAYEFAVRHVGMSRDAGDIWTDYIRFVKDREAKTEWIQGQKMDELRRIYQRVVGIPVNNVEEIWREYNQFETGLKRDTAKKFMQLRSPAYMTARSALREMKLLVDPLRRPLLPRLPAWDNSATSNNAISPADVARDRQSVEGWKAYLEWEESDPLELAETEKDSFRKRVELAYAKATMHMRFYPEIWWMAAKWAEKINGGGKVEESLKILQDGLKACPGSFLLGFAAIEAHEHSSSAAGSAASSYTAACSTIFESLLSHIHAQIEALQQELTDSQNRIDARAAEQKAQALAARRAGGEADEIEGEEREEQRKQEEARDAEKAALTAASMPRIDSLKEEASLIWIKWMHFVRRTEGLRPTRVIFGKARKSPHATWQIYEASALMEYHCSKDPNVATKVFELALKTFGTDEAFVVRYLDFLISINDENNARALFERTIPTFPAERARPLWDRWSLYEYSFGDTASIRKLEARLTEAYPEESGLKRFRDRCSYMDLEVIGRRDLGDGFVGSSTNGQASAGSTAADRMVRAANGAAEMGAPMSSTAAINAATGGKRSAATGPDDEGNDAKRLRGNSPVPIGTAGPSTMRRGPLPPQQAVFPSNNGPPPSQVGPPAGFGGPPAPVAMAHPPLPDAILYFLSVLPPSRAFDGPKLPAEQIIEAVRSSSIQVSGVNGGPPRPNGMMPPMPIGGGNGGAGAGGRRRGGRR